MERVFAQLRALQSTHAPCQRQHNCAIVYNLPPNLEPRACLDSRVFGGNYGICFHLEFTWYRSRFSGSPPCQRTAYWYFRAVCNNVSRKNIFVSSKKPYVIHSCASHCVDVTIVNSVDWRTIEQFFNLDDKRGNNLRGNTSKHARCLLEAHAQVRATLPASPSRGLYLQICEKRMKKLENKSTFDCWHLFRLFWLWSSISETVWDSRCCFPVLPLALSRRSTQ